MSACRACASGCHSSLQFGAVALVYMALAAALTLLLSDWLADRWTAALLAVALLAPLLLYHVRRAFAPMNSLFRALAGSVASYRDGDYSFGLSWAGRDELGELVASHNALGHVLREQRLGLVQRELLLDTMVQNTPVAMLLVDPSRRVVYANIAARQLLGEGRKLEGQRFRCAARSDAATPLREAFERGGDGMFTARRRRRQRRQRDSTTSRAATSASTAAATNWCCCASSPPNCAARKCRPGRR